MTTDLFHGLMVSLFIIKYKNVTLKNLLENFNFYIYLQNF